MFCLALFLEFIKVLLLNATMWLSSDQHNFIIHVYLQTVIVRYYSLLVKFHISSITSRIVCKT